MCAFYLAALLTGAAGADPAPTLEDRPLGSKIHFSAIHYAEGKDRPRQLMIRGTLDGKGGLELNPNHLTLDSDGRIVATTLLGWRPIPVQIKPVDTPDPDKSKKGRKVYDVVPVAGERPRQYSLVLSPNEAGPHDLLIREGEKVVGVYPMLDPDREEHRRLVPELAKASPEEQKAIAELRKHLGYDFRFRLESKDAVTFLYFPNGAGDLTKIDPALAGLKNLTFLSFNGVKLPSEGLKCVRNMSALKTLDFTDSEIDDAGLACVKDATQLEMMSFFGSRGLTDKGLTHLQGLKNLKLLDLRNESFKATEPKAPRVTDAGLKHLASCTKLEFLHLQGQHITDEGLKHLSGVTNLGVLSLSFSGITDEGLKHLYELQKLVKLHLYDTKVTPEGMKALRAKVPSLLP